MKHPKTSLSLLALAACLLTSSAAFGQIRYSVAAGPNFTALEADLGDLSNLQSVENATEIGFFANLGLSLDAGPLAVRSGLNYVSAGAIFDGSNFLERDDFTVSFITIPVELAFAFSAAPGVRPYVLGGGERRFRLDLSDDEIDFQDNLKTQSTAATIGAGVSLTVPGFGISVSPEVRYAVDIDGLTTGEVTVGDELVRIRDEFKADMLRFGIVLGFQ